MKPAPFEYHRPASLAETFDLLDQYGDDGRVLAGGQSLVPTLNMWSVSYRAQSSKGWCWSGSRSAAERSGSVAAPSAVR